MTNAKMQKTDYPEDRPDWLMVEEYAKRKSVFGCILCEKTHKVKDCEHKANRDKKSTYEVYKAQYSNYGD
jgi:hypothetical protein